MSSGVSWLEANQQYLVARVALARERVAGSPAGAMGRVEAASKDLPAPAALDTLSDAFGLSPFECDILLLCAGMELDGTQSDAPTFSLALSALPDAHWSALTPAGPLRHWRLIEVGAGDTLTRCPLRIDERVLHYLAGLAYLDVRLHGWISPVAPPAELPATQLAAADSIGGFLSSGTAVQVMGEDYADRLSVAALACARVGVALHSLHAADLPPVSDREALARIWEREAVFSRSALLVDCDQAENRRAALAFVESLRGMVLITGREPLRSWKRQIVRVDVPRPTADEQRSLWHATLGPTAERLNGHLDAVITNFRLGLPGIRAAASQARAAIEATPEVPPSILWDACRVQARASLDGLAQRIEPAVTWHDLVLPEQQNATLREIATQVRYRTRVYDQWGFAAKGARGLGISALFAGSSGTGKTLAAEVIANELRLDLYRIDLSQVVSKYIGETEKNLQRVFDAAEESGAVLLFDEADALYGKRSEVRDSHDRYANIEVSYLLQRMEAYRGLAILTTNMKALLDTAFLRRIRFVVEFPFPDATYRAHIWRRMFPAATPTEGLDHTRLANLSVAGGNIRNIALQAAFFAAESGEPVRMRHLLRAARSEYAKLDKPLTDAETRGWI